MMQTIKDKKQNGLNAMKFKEGEKGGKEEGQGDGEGPKGNGKGGDERNEI